MAKVEMFNAIVAQDALDQVKVDLLDLANALECWKGQPDVWERVENWLYNTNRHLTDMFS